MPLVPPGSAIAVVFFIGYQKVNVWKKTGSRMEARLGPLIWPSANMTTGRSSPLQTAWSFEFRPPTVASIPDAVEIIQFDRIVR